MLINKYDTLIIGSGIAGLNLARKLSAAGQKIFISSKEAVTEGSSKYAQGGIAAVNPSNLESDSLESHIQDTLLAGKELCNEQIVRELLGLAWEELEDLMQLGLQFDPDLNIEGSHSHKRVLHVGDATGRVVLKQILDIVSRNQNVSIGQGHEMVSLIRESNSSRVIGASFINIAGDVFDIFAENIVLATGGAGALFKETSNPSILTGDGIVLAYDAGAKVENLEFIQFHPTVFKSSKGRFLISEALRGAGARLLNANQEAFLSKSDLVSELSTRDVLTRAISREMQATNSDFVYLDARSIPKNVLQKSFPNIYEYALMNGFELSSSLLPVSPAAHYTIGGIKTDLQGRTNLPGLFAIGESASNGLHGANRLASNSLLECIVSAGLLARFILSQDSIPRDSSDYEYCSHYDLYEDYQAKAFHSQDINQIRQIMSDFFGVERKLKPMQFGLKSLEELSESKERNMALLIAKSALLRKESRGAHFRLDFPRSSSAYRRSTVLSNEQKLRLLSSSTL